MMAAAKFRTKAGTRKYVFRPGARVPKGLDPQIVGDALAAIYTRDGQLRSRDVVDEARPAAAPLHGAFEWRDDVAAEEHRRWQARELIRDVEVITVEAKPEIGRKQEQVSVYVHVPHGRQGHYGDIDDVIQRPEQFAAALAAAMAKRDQMQSFIEHLKRRVEGSPNYADKAAALQVALEGLAAVRLALEHAA